VVREVPSFCEVGGSRPDVLVFSRNKHQTLLSKAAALNKHFHNRTAITPVVLTV
jgi:hypothetical protein